MRKRLRLLLRHYDQYGIIAVFGWLAASMVITAIYSILIIKMSGWLTNLDYRASSSVAMFFLWPVLIYTCPILWAAVTLISERIWILTGIYHLLGWEPNRFKKVIEKIADEVKP